MKLTLNRGEEIWIRCIFFNLICRANFTFSNYEVFRLLFDLEISRFEQIKYYDVDAQYIPCKFGGVRVIYVLKNRSFSRNFSIFSRTRATE